MTDTGNTTNPSNPAQGHSRAQGILNWLKKRSEHKLARLGWEWFQKYLEASRNSACAISIYGCLSVVPAALVFVALIYKSGSGDVPAFATNLVHHLRLSGSTATLVQDMFGKASSNALAATVTMIVTFLLWGIGIGQLYQDVYARAWGVEVRSLADQALFTIFFFVLAGAVSAAIIAQSELGPSGRLGLLFLIGVVGSLALWLVAPYYLLHRKISYRQLLPGAVMATILLVGTVAIVPLFLPPTLETNGKAFGSFGIALTLVGYIFTLVTMTVASAVFSPVWLAFREEEKTRAAAAG